MKRTLLLAAAVLTTLGLASTALAQDLRLVLPVGHTQMIQSVDYSPDGKLVVTASEDKMAIVWDTETGAELHRLQHNAGVYKAEFSPDGKSIFVSSRDFVKVWELETGKERYPDLKGRLLEVLPAQSPLIKTIIATAEDDVIRIWDAQSGKKLHSFRSSHWVTSVKFSPHGTSLISTQSSGYGTGDNSVKHWHLLTGEELPPLAKHSNTVTTAEFSPDGKTVVTASEDSNVRIWNAETGEELFLLPNHMEGVESAHFSPDGKTLVTGSRDHTARVWDSTTGLELHVLDGHSDRVWAEFSPDGNKILTKSEGKVRIWDTKSGKELPSNIGHDDNNYISQLIFGNDNTVFTGSSGGAAKLWDLKTGQELYSFNHRTSINSAEFSPNGLRLITASGDWYSDDKDNTAKIWDLQTGELLQHLRGESTASFSFDQLVPNGTRVNSNTGNNSVEVWDLLTGSTLNQLQGHSSAVYSRQFSPDGTTIVTASSDSTVRIWDAANGAELHNLPHPEMAYRAVFDPKGEKIATISSDYILRFWNVNSGECINAVQSLDDLIVNVQFSPNGETLLSSGMSNTFVLRDASTATEIATLILPYEDKIGFGEGGAAAQYSPNGKTIVTACNDEIDSESVVLQLWDAASGDEIRQLAHIKEQIYRTDFSPNGSLLLTGSTNGTVRIWNLNTGKNVPLKGHSDAVTAVVFSPDGQTVVTGSVDHTVIIWDVEDGRMRFRLLGHSNDVSSIQFSSDGKTIITTSLDNTVKVWDVASGKLLYTRLSLESGGWLVWDPEYRFDGSAGAIDLMHFACGLEAIGLEQAKGELRVRNLVSRIMSGEDLSPQPGLDDLDLCGRTPIVTPLPGDGRGYRFDIEPRKGGVSSCEVYIDGVRRLNIPASDLQPQDDGHLLLTVSAEQVAEYATAAEAEVTVIARTAGNLTSRGEPTFVSVPDPRGNSRDSKPAFHGLFVGINDYKGDGLKLNYAAADARELGQVVEAAAKRLFGEDEVHVTTLLSDAATGAVTNPPEKHRVLAELEAIAERSNARDILFIHLAGHGNVNADGEFVFLTSEASSLQDGDYTGVTMREINDALMGVKASQRILILDACHSGEAVQDLLGDGSMDMAYTARNNVSVEEDIARGRQLDRLGDNANMTMLTASASDQAAFELPEIGHGLLTFALLDAIQGHTDILTEGRFLEVKPWVYQAEKTVNDRSTGPNRQQAQALTPANYPIGEITADVRELIQIQEKPVIKRIVFEDENEELAEVFEEALKLALSEESGARGSGSVLINEQHPKGITLKGTAVDQGNGTYSVSFTLKRKGEHIGQGEGNGLTIEDVIARIQALLSE